jgi:hypothetical protein
MSQKASLAAGSGHETFVGGQQSVSQFFCEQVFG